MIRRARRRAGRRRTVAIAGILLLLVLAVGAGLWAVAGGGDSARSASRRPFQPVTVPTTTPPPPFERYWFTGDSVASNLADPMAELASARGLSWVNAPKIGCRVLEGRPTASDGTVIGPTDCESLERRVLDDELGDAQVAVILSSWEIAGLLLGDENLAYGTPEWEAATFDLWSRALDALESAGVRSVVIVAHAPPADWIQALTPEGFQYAEDVRQYERFLARVAARHADMVTVVRLSSIVCPGGSCPTVIGDVELRPRDGGHFSPEGAVLVTPELLDAVVTAANRLS